jgi:hypothetical protein
MDAVSEARAPHHGHDGGHGHDHAHEHEHQTGFWGRLLHLACPGAAVMTGMLSQEAVIIAR